MNEKIRKYCRNYNLIINCEFLDDDLFSRKLVDYYKNVILNTDDADNSIEKLKKIDFVMGRYIEDYKFSKKLRSSIDVASFLNSSMDLTDMICNYIVQFFEKYRLEKEEVIENTKWI